MLRGLGQFFLNRGYQSSNAQLVSPGDTLAKGSENVLITGTGKTSVFRGLAQYFIDEETPYLGGNVSFSVGDDFASLTNAGDDIAVGSVFRVLGALFFIGAGTLRLNGADTGSTATTTLQLQLFRNGVLQPEVYQAGLPQPSAPVIAAVAPPAGYAGKNTGSVSVQVSAVRSATGARSLASPTSNIVICSNQSVRVTFPQANTLNGQDYWEVAVTLNGYGGVGAHYFLQEIPEAVLSSTGADAEIITSATLTSTDPGTLDVPNGTLSTSNLGWTAQSYQQAAVTLTGTAPFSVGQLHVMMAFTNSAIEFDVLVSSGSTLESIAEDIRAVLNLPGNASRVQATGSGAEIIVTRTEFATHDPAFELSIEDEGFGTQVDDVSSTITQYGLNTYVTKIKGSNTGVASNTQEITVAEDHDAAFTQPVYFRRAVEGVPRSFVFEWRDSDLVASDFAAIREYPPPAGLFGGVLGDVTFVDGAYGDSVNIVDRTATVTTQIRGNAIAVSDPARPESYPPDNYLFTNDAPSALIEGGQGLYWRFGKNSLGVIRYVGGQPAISYETLWKGIGIADQNNAVLGAGGRLYAYTRGRGAVRLGQQGEPDTLFAAAVADDMADWNAANVCLGYDPSYNYVMFAHERTILCFYEPLDVWCAPIVLPENFYENMEIKSFVTVDGAIFISVGNDEEIYVYGFNNGDGSVGRFVTQWNMSLGEFDIISRIKLGLRTDGPTPVSVSTYINGSETPTREQMVDITEAGIHVPSTLKPNVRQARSWKIATEIESAGGDAGLEVVMVEGTNSGITV